MKHYEYTYLTRQDMPEETAKSLQDKLGSMIASRNGIVSESPKSYKKRLAYRIKNQDAAYVNTILFQTEPAEAVAFKKEADAMPEILRAIIVSYDPEKLKKEPRRERPMASVKTPVLQAETEKPAAAKEPEETEKPAPKTKAEPKEAAKEEIKEEEGKEEEGKKEEEAKEEKPKPRRRKIKAELRDIEEKLDEILK